MNRRALFGKLGAVAAAAIVAPAVKAEAAEAAPPIDAQSWSLGWDAAESLAYKRGLADAQDAIADARAEGYVRGWDVRDAAAESTATALRLRRSDGTTARIPATVTAWWDGAEGQSMRGFRT